MSVLRKRPRGMCPDCGQSLAINENGKLHKHKCLKTLMQTDEPIKNAPVVAAVPMNWNVNVPDMTAVSVTAKSAVSEEEFLKMENAYLKAKLLEIQGCDFRWTSPEHSPKKQQKIQMPDVHYTSSSHPKMKHKKSLTHTSDSDD